ncbi:helix-turn-helix domain-containing protein [Nocardioides montaniterrae]
MHGQDTRDHAAALRAAGSSWRAISRELGVPVSTLLKWHRRPDALRLRMADCPTCGDEQLDTAAYSALLGFYLGDGHISRNHRFYCLRITCDATQSRVIDDVTECVRAMRPHAKVFHARKPGAIDVTSNWQHWPCLFPQHGPGRKHERLIALENWQRSIVEQHPEPFLRGLFHSDGCRVMNSTTKLIGGEPKTYWYPRWQFVNASADIRELCCWALDLVGVAWRQSNPRVISVSRREAVALLDGLIGSKT